MNHSKPSTSSTGTGTGARPSKPNQIYRRGKPIQTDLKVLSSDEEEEDSNQEQQQPPPPPPIINLEISNLKLPTQSKQTNSSSHPPSSSSSGSSSSESESEASKSKPRAKSKQSKIKSPPSVSSSDSGSGSGSDESGSSDEETPKLAPIYKPVFISKRQRDTLLSKPIQDESEEAIEARRQVELEERRLQSQRLVEETLKRELAEKEIEEVFPEVDDTDGLDPEAEFEAWRLRELIRLKREKDAMLEREKEKEALEARRALPESERLEDDLKFAAESRASKPKGQQAFLQKYHHKGAFYSDAEVLKKHDFTAPTEGTTKRMELLPAAMQVRDFGKMSRTKWTHLVKEDTTSQDAGWSQKGRLGKDGNLMMKSGCFNCGGPHLKRDCPSTREEVGTGSNGSKIGIKVKRTVEGDQRDYPSKRRDDKYDGRRGDREGDSDRRNHRDRSRSRDRYRDRGRDEGKRDERNRESDRDRRDYGRSDRNYDDRERRRSKERGRR